MLNPVVIPPLPLALLVVAALAGIALTVNRWLEGADAIAATLTGARPAGGRHRLDAATDPYRPRTWADLVAERAARQAAEIPYPSAEWRQALTDFERQVGLAENVERPAVDDDTRELVAIR